MKLVYENKSAIVVESPLLRSTCQILCLVIQRCGPSVFTQSGPKLRFILLRGCIHAPRWAPAVRFVLAKVSTTTHNTCSFHNISRAQKNFLQKFRVYNLPNTLLIREYIPEKDERWTLYLQLIDIVDILFSPYITKDYAIYLSTLINDHHDNFCHPKMHFMIHMPRLIIK